uniref:Uncharacterized protein n=1 Tax=Bactrocera latifrons TaxID=174628 RepID=A0A0K8VP22_BACLA
MQYYDTGLSETMSIVTSTDTASNWSKPVKRKPKRRNTVSAFPKRKTRPLMSKKLHSKKFVENNTFITKTPCLKLRRYHLKIRRPSNLSVKQTKALIERINDESRVAHYLWPRIHQRTAELEAEIAHLQQRLRQLQTEEVDIKRKRWCRNCQEEATYIHAKRFYCSTYCEEQFSKTRNQQ